MKFMKQKKNNSRCMLNSRLSRFNRFASAFVAAAMLVGCSEFCTLDGTVKEAKADMVNVEVKQPPLVLKYDEPATDWESQALPIGNGRIGAMVFGGVGQEKIQVNESSVWSGGPGSNQNYDGGDNNYSKDEVHGALQNIRGMVNDMIADFRDNNSAYIDGSGKIVSSNFPDLLTQSDFKNNLNKLKGEKDNFGSYQTLGNIYIEDSNSEYENYLRTSDIDKSVQTVTYEQDGVTYKREYFMNNPSNVFVARLTSSGAGKLTKTVKIDSEQTKKTIAVNENDGVITMEGQPSDQKENGLKFAQYIKVLNSGGQITKSGGDGLKIENADEIVIIMSSATNYKSDATTGYDYFEDEDPYYKVEDYVNAAIQKGYDSLYAEHVADYKKLYDRCTFNLGLTEAPDVMTDELVSGYGKTNSAEEDRYLEILFYQYGRYLLISSSRENSLLPANLQGIWAQGLSPAWQSDYHTNINLQMNYWPAEQTNLTECHDVLIRYINDMVEKGKVTADKYYCKEDGSDVRGWVIHHENNIYGNTSPSYFETAFYFPAAAAWECQDIWEKYMFNCDRQFLADNFDTILQAALFWVDNLCTDTDGTLVSNPSYSPEHGNYTLGCVSDQTIIWEVFEYVKKGANILGLSDNAEVREVIAAQEKLYMPKADDLTIGGQFREWKDETTLEITNSDAHRHQNQLFALHPGTYVVAGRSEQDDILMDAARTTLEKRGDAGTGWSKAWKINMWARLRDGDRALKLLGEQLKGSTLSNLFDTHPPFQIDGNFGATSGIAEMLMQSQGDYVEPLAALPYDWSDGSYTGIKARGNFTVDVTWNNGISDEMKITSGSGNECRLRYAGVSSYYILDETNGELINPSVIDGDTVSFPTQAGAVYKITSYPQTAPPKPQVTPPAGTGNTGNNGQVMPPVNGSNKTEVPAVPKIKGIKNIKGKKITVTLKKRVKGADGYIIRYSSKKNMKKAKKVKIANAKITKKTIKGLKKGKTYYVQVRSFVKSSDGNVYSKWSGSKKVKVKR